MTDLLFISDLIQSIINQLPLCLICTAYHAEYWIIMSLVNHISFCSPIFCDQREYNGPPILSCNAILGVDLVYSRCHIFFLSAFPLLKLTWTTVPLETGHLSGHSWTTWLDLIGQKGMGQSWYLAQGKSKHRIHSLYLCLFIFLSPFLSLIPEFRYRGLAIHSVIDANIYRSLRVMATVFPSLTQPPETHRKQETYRSRSSKKIKEHMQREAEIPEYWGPVGEGEHNIDWAHIFNVWLLTAFEHPPPFSSAPHLSKLIRKTWCSLLWNW